MYVDRASSIFVFDPHRIDARVRNHSFIYSLRAATDTHAPFRSRRFKRRDWNYLHKADGSASDSDSDSSIESAGGLASSSDDDGDDEVDDGDEEDSQPSASTSEDDAEDEENVSSDDETATRRRYEEARGIIEKCLRGDEDVKAVAAKCRACPGTLLLSAASMRSHLASKKHAKNVAKLGRAGEDFMALYPAVREEDGIVSDGEAETHAERLARLRAQRILGAEGGKKAKSSSKFSLDQFDSSDDDDGDDDGGDSESDSENETRRMAKKELVKKMSRELEDDKKKRSRRHAQSKRKSKPGKRQRQAMKEAGK